MRLVFGCSRECRNKQKDRRNGNALSCHGPFPFLLLLGNPGKCLGVEWVMAESRKGVLFLCVANSARSQMAEGLARSVAPGDLEIYSAGSAPTRLNPFAREVMQELGIDISSNRSKAIEDIPSARIGTVITLCAEEVCPVFPGNVERFHWPFEDPASAEGSDEKVREEFRRVRDQIRTKIGDFFKTGSA